MKGRRGHSKRPPKDPALWTKSFTLRMPLWNMRTPARKGILNAFWAEHTQRVQNLDCMDFSLVTLKLEEDSGTILSKLWRKIISNLEFYIQPNYSWRMGVTWRLFQICKTSKLYLPFPHTQEANITSSLSMHLPMGTWVASVSWLL